MEVINLSDLFHSLPPFLLFHEFSVEIQIVTRHVGSEAM